MHRKALRRVFAVLAGLAGALVLAGCKPDIPLIPFVEGDAYPASASVRANDLAPFIESTGLLIDAD